MNYPQQMLNFLADTIFPVSCLGCGRFSPQNKKEYLCKSCLGLIPIKNNFECTGCKTATPLGKTCFNCTEFSVIDNLLIVSDYNNPLIEKAIKTLKYRMVPDIAASLRPLFKKYIRHLVRDKNFNLTENYPLVVPVPLHLRRLNWRGFNQAEILSNMIGEITQLTVKNEILMRNKFTKPQADVQNKEERLKNLAGKFSVNKNVDINKRTILLVDDVCTTGGTLREAASVLKSGGASKVICLVIARG